MSFIKLNNNNNSNDTHSPRQKDFAYNNDTNSSFSMIEPMMLERERRRATGIRSVPLCQPLVKVFRIKAMNLIGSVSLLVTGIVLTVIGIWWLLLKHKGAAAFLTLGLFTMVPGLYGFYEVVGAMRGWNGFEHVLLNDEDDNELGSSLEWGRL